jgi:hypothetical protein
MARKRALKDVAMDPLAKKEPLDLPKKKANPKGGTHPLTIALAFAVGLASGFLSYRFLRIWFLR